MIDIRATRSPVIPAKAGIQYAAASRFYHWRSGILGARSSRAMTACACAVICPSGTFLSSLFSVFPKNISVPTHPKSDLELSHPTPPEGRIAIVTDAGCGCGGRGSVRRATWLQGGSCKWPVSDQTASRRTALTRTAKSCGPDAPTLASSSRRLVGPTGRGQNLNPLDDGGKRARSPGRARHKLLKPLRAGMPGDSGVLVVTRVRSTNTKCTRGRGCNGHPAFPTPSLGERVS